MRKTACVRSCKTRPRLWRASAGCACCWPATARFACSTRRSRRREGLRVALAAEPVDSSDPLLYHKTTHRVMYDRQLAARPDCDDVVLYNERGELTECCIGNLVLERDGVCYTPSVESGLLAGTFRAELLTQGQLCERLLPIGELARADALYLINSVRRWVELELV